jgi:hypothetical protein
MHALFIVLFLTCNMNVRQIIDVCPIFMMPAMSEKFVFPSNRQPPLGVKKSGRGGAFSSVISLSGRGKLMLTKQQVALFAERVNSA